MSEGGWIVFVLFALCAGFGAAVLRLGDRWEVARRRRARANESPRPRSKEESTTEGNDGGVSGDWPLSEWLASGFLVGIAVVGLLAQGANWTRLRLGPGGWTVIGGGMALAVLVWAILDFPVLRAGGKRTLAGLREGVARARRGDVSPGGWLAIGCAALGMLAVAWSFRQAVGLPITGWDPLSFWYLKTKILFHEGTVFCPDYFDADRFHAHTDYPVLINWVEAGICHAVGEYRERPMKCLWAVWQLACLVLAGLAMVRRRGAVVAWAVVALIALLPALLDADTTGAVSAYRDAPLALLILVAACLALDWVDTAGRSGGAPRVRDTVRLVLLLALMMGTKREGTVWAAAIALTATGAVWRMGIERSPEARRKPNTAKTKPKSLLRRIPFELARATDRTVFWLLVLPWVLMLPWFSVRAQLPFPRSENFLEVMGVQTWADTGLRAAVVLEALRNELFARVQKWGVLWWVFAAVAIWNRRAWNARERLFALLIPIGWAMACTGFVFTPWGDPTSHLAVSIDRLILQGAPLAIWLLGVNLVAARPDDPAAEGR